MNTTDTIKNLANKLDKELAKFDYQQDEIYATIQITKAELLALEDVSKEQEILSVLKGRCEGISTYGGEITPDGIRRPAYIEIDIPSLKDMTEDEFNYLWGWLKNDK